MAKPRKPTIDERLQALIQSLELLASFHGDLEKRHADFEKRQGDSEKRNGDFEKRQKDLEKRQEEDAAALHQIALIFRDVHGSIQGLERIATAHQVRLDDHGQRIQHLEDK